jgi:hypothetical protein
MKYARVSKGRSLRALCRACEWFSQFVGNTGTGGTFFLDWDIDETTSRLSPGFIPQPSETPPTAPNVRFTCNPEVIHLDEKRASVEVKP